jgi:hypothetical protein
MRICTDKTGKLIEMQSHATAGTLIQNALNAGYRKDDITEQEVTAAEWAVVLDAQPKPTAAKSPIDALTEALIAKGTITQSDIDAKKLKA